MFIKFEDGCGDHMLVNLPDSVCWKLCYRLFGDDGCEDCGLYLIIDDEKILIRDPDFWCQGRPNLRYYAVGDLYEEMVDVIASKIENEPNLRVIDISAIERQLLEEKYEKQWIEKGYVERNADGSW